MAQVTSRWSDLPVGQMVSPYPRCKRCGLKDSRKRFPFVCATCARVKTLPRSDWQERGKCRPAPGATPEEVRELRDRFFPRQGGTAAEARQMCQGCPVINECLRHALTTPELVGVWGGTTEKQRRKLRRELYGRTA